jgi:Gamma-glutamyl cyclotransferase, AIG2-like
MMRRIGPAENRLAVPEWPRKKKCAAGPSGGYTPLDAPAAGRDILGDETGLMPLLFSYGTLQQENVQLSTFGRTLAGRSDQLEHFEESLVPIEDEDVIARSGKTHHPIVRFTGRSSDRIDGTAFEITDAELAAADAYEVAAYKRIDVVLASGLRAWVYVDARYASKG